VTQKNAEKLVNRQHAVAAVLAAWLILTSPWVAMLGKVPQGAGFFDYAHIVAGFLAMLISVSYTISCVRDGGWRLYFPWASGNLGAVGRDLAGLLRGRVPSAEGGGLFAMIEGLLLVAFIAAAVSGAVWALNQGTDLAMAWRSYHVLAARTFAGLLVLHVLAVASHLLDFVR
jgi:hypothetical protein